MKHCKHFFMSVICSLTFIAYGNLYSEESIASISIENKLAVPGDTVLIAVTATGFQNIAAVDCRIVFNENVLDALSTQYTVVNLHPGLSSSIYNVIDGNMVSLAWFSLTPLSIPDGEKLFDLQLIFCNEQYLCALNGTTSSLDFIEDQTSFVSGDDEIPLEYNHGSISAYVPLKALNLNKTGEGLVMVNKSIYAEPLTADQNTVLTLQAIPKAHWAFDKWSGDTTGTDNPLSLLMNDHKNLNVIFIEDTIPFDYTLSLAIVGHGTVETNGEPYAPLLVFDEVTAVSLEAFADYGWAFVAWTGDLVGTDNPKEFLVDGNNSVIAIFEELIFEDYTLTVNTIGEGTVEINGELYTAPLTFEEGTPINMLAIPAMNWLFDGWSGDIESVENPIAITMDKHKNIEACFSPKRFTVAFEIKDSNFIPVNNAIVSLDDNMNPQGDYIFTGIEPGIYNYSVEAEGFLTKTGSIQVIDADVLLSLFLEEDPTTVINVLKMMQFIDEPPFFIIYPNPVKDRFSLVLRCLLNVSVLNVKVYNMHGELVFIDEASTDQPLTFSLESQPPGLYVIKAISASNAGVGYIIKID